MSADLRRCVLAPAAVAAMSLVVPPASEGQTSDVRALPPRAVEEITALLAAKAQWTRAQRKISSRLLLRVDGFERSPGEAAARTATTVEEQVLVDIRADVTPQVLDRIRRLEGAVINTVPRYRAVRARLPLGALETLADLDAVQTIRPAEDAVTPRGARWRPSVEVRAAASDTRAPGRVGARQKVNTSEGDVAHQADVARTTHAVDGTGIGIAVLSSGVKSLKQRQATGDLPDRVTLLREVGSTDWGTGILELVHDLAPGAELYFSYGYVEQAQRAADLETLCDMGADVIAMDVYNIYEPAFQDGIIARGVNAAVAKGCFVFGNVGHNGNVNDGTSGVWEGDYVEGSQITMQGSFPHPDRLTVTAHDFGESVVQNEIAKESATGYVLQWADPLGASSNDYDLFLITRGGRILGSSLDTQNGSQDPREHVQSPSRDDAGLRLVVVKASNAEDRYLRVDSFLGEFAVGTAGSVFGGRSAETAVTVGAVEVDSAGGDGGVFNGTESVWTGSSDGPRRIFFEVDGTAITPGNFSSTGGRLVQKPEIVTAICASTTAIDLAKLCGSSGAPGHAAAIAALMLEAAGGPARVTRSDLVAAMTGAALDIEEAGVDRDSGAGIVMAPGAVAAVAVAVTNRNRAPTATGELEDLELAANDNAVTIDLATTFTDPDGDTLSYKVWLSNDDVEIELTGPELAVTPVAPASVSVLARAIDPGGLSEVLDFSVSVTPEKLAPEAVGVLAGQTLRVGDGSEVVDVSSAFRDPEGDPLTYAASSSSSAVSVWMSDSRLTLTPLGAGRSTITVTAAEVSRADKSARQGFEVLVLPAQGVTVAPQELTLTEDSSESYTVVLSSEPTASVEVAVVTDLADTDLSVNKTRLTFTRDTWSVAQEIEVTAADDADAVADAPVTIRHSVSGGDYGSVPAASVEATIVENDTPTLSVGSEQGVEGVGELIFDVRLTVAGSSEVTVEYATSDGSGPSGATAGSDYTTTNGTLTYAAGTTGGQEIRVPIIADAVDEEEEETFTLTLSNARNAALAGGGSTLQVTGTIHDDDDPEVAVSFGTADRQVVEGDSVVVPVLLSADPERLVSIPLVRSHLGGATASDYSGIPLRVVFARGETRQEFRFAASDDSEDDDGEAVRLAFGPPPARVSVGGEMLLAIVDDDDDDGGGGGSGGGGGAPPRAAITVDAECADGLCRARTGAAVRFEDSSSGSVRSRRWEFGDGSRRSNRTVGYAWSAPGFYDVTLWTSNGRDESTASLTFLVEASEPAGTCEADAETLCLQDSRYAVGVDWWTADGGSGSASVVHSGTNDSGLFWFFAPNNWEVLIKVLDGCAQNGNMWVFGASTTDLGYTIRVTDTVTGMVKEYRNEPGLPAPAIADTTAFSQGCR